MNPVAFLGLMCLITVALTEDLPAPFASVSTTEGQSTIVEGDTVVLKCGYDVEKVKYVVWYHKTGNSEGGVCNNGDTESRLIVYNKMYSSDNGTNAWRNRAFGVEREEGYYVTLQNVEITDDETYVCCTGPNEWGLKTIQSNDLVISVTVKPSVGILQDKNSLDTFAKERSNLTCIVDRVKPPGSASVAWYLDDVLQSGVQEPAYSRLNADGKTYLTLSSLRKSFSPEDDGKVLRCMVKWVVENHVKEEISTDEGQLRVWYPPQWAATTHTVYAEINSDVTMTCHVKSSPAKPSIRWYKRGFGSILHNGETFQFQKVSKVNFTQYECEADNGVGPPRRFEVELKESGRPHLLTASTLPNTTSSMVTLEWRIGSSGGHPPLTYTVSSRVQGQKEFHLVSDEIEQVGKEGEDMLYDVTGLSPNTMYEFQIVARNDRKTLFPDKPDTSEDLEVAGKTRVVPLVEITETTLEEDSLYVKWDFSNIIQELNRNYEVSIKIKYGKKPDFVRIHKIYPADNTVVVTRGEVTIQDRFDVSKEYTVVPIVYENDQLSQVSPTMVQVTKQSGVNMLLLAILISSVVVAAVVILVVVLLCRRKGPLKRRQSTGHKRYNGDYMLEKDIYEELKVKTKPPKLPSRNNSLNEPRTPLPQNNNITAIQTMYLTLPRPDESGGGASGGLPETPPVHSEIQPAGGGSSSMGEGADYLVPLKTSMQITVSQNNSPPAVEYEKERRLENISEEEKAEIDKLLPAPENHYLPMCKE